MVCPDITEKPVNVPIAIAEQVGRHLGRGHTTAGRERRQHPGFSTEERQVSERGGVRVVHSPVGGMKKEPQTDLVVSHIPLLPPSLQPACRGTTLDKSRDGLTADQTLTEVQDA